MWGVIYSMGDVTFKAFFFFKFMFNFEGMWGSNYPCAVVMNKSKSWVLVMLIYHLLLASKAV